MASAMVTRDGRAARIAIVEQHIRLENAHDLEGVLGTFGDTARYDDEPWGEHYEGRSGVGKFYEQLMEALLALVEPTERGDPESCLRWTCKSLRRLAAELCAQGHRISHTVVGELLKTLNFSLQANSKTREGDGHPDRDAQFRYINRVVKTALNKQQPVISVDTKKKELVGDFKNGGREWRRRRQLSWPVSDNYLGR